MTAIIIEDELLSAQHLSLLLHRYDAGIAIKATFDTVKAAVSAFQNGLIADVLFLDIHLADGNGFDIFKQTAVSMPVIFTTAYDQYAIQAFKQNSIDYLLKPIAFADVSFALNKFKQQQATANSSLIQQIAQAYQQIQQPYKTRFLVKTGNTIDTVPTDAIHHFTTQESLSILVTPKGIRYVIDDSLDQLATQLSPKDFFRINRKVIIHIQSIEKVYTAPNGRLTIASKLLSGEDNIVSRKRVQAFKTWLGG